MPHIIACKRLRLVFCKSQEKSWRRQRSYEGEPFISDHLDAPGLKPLDIDARVDIYGIYLFQKPEDANKTILVFNANPMVSTLTDSFADYAVYELKIDTNGDRWLNAIYRYRYVSGQECFWRGSETSMKENGIVTRKLLKHLMLWIWFLSRFTSMLNI